jgi:uncharacterized protein (UPF0332 family)
MTATESGLLKKARRSLQFAEIDLREQGYEFAISKAYYAMFHVARAFLLAKGLTYKKHSAVHSAFGQYFANPGIVPAQFHRYLLDAHAARNVADYFTEPDFTDEDAMEHIAHAKEFLDYAERTLPSLPQ